MHWGSALAIYFVLWWVTLFIAFPFGMRSQAEVGEITDGTEPGAPAKPNFLKRMAWNTVLSGVVFFVFWFVFYYLDISVGDLPRIIPPAD